MGINTGILTNADPLSTEQIKRLEAMVVENNIAVVYLDEEGQLCFAMPRGECVQGIKDLAWNNAYALSSTADGITKKAYRKTGLKTVKLDKVFKKGSIQQNWTEDYPEPGFYRNGVLAYRWDEQLGKALSVSSYDRTLTSVAGEFLFETGCTDVVLSDTVISIGACAFMSCMDCLINVTIPDSVVSIGNNAFQNCAQLTNFYLPNSVTSIGDYAFADCHGLTSLAIPDSVEEIGNYAISYCSNLSSITMGENVVSIGEGAFECCTQLRNFYITPAVNFIGGSAFRSTSITSITIPNNVTEISEYTFESCHELSSVSLGLNTTIIGDGAFLDCDKLTKITIPSSVTFIGEGAFYGCRALAEIYFDGTVEQWNAISKGDGWNSHVIAASVTCSDGQVTL
jgi:hypothetical protein